MDDLLAELDTTAHKAPPAKKVKVEKNRKSLTEKKTQQIPAASKPRRETCHTVKHRLPPKDMAQSPKNPFSVKSEQNDKAEIKSSPVKLGKCIIASFSNLRTYHRD